MNWPHLLASYPRKLLGSNLPLVLLALLERSGLVTEIKLLAQSGADEFETKSALFDLRLNSLIEYGSNHIRITDRGRHLLNRFSLDQEILRDTLDLLALHGTERESYRHALSAYRESAYSSYLNSLGSLHTWSAICHDEPPGPSLDSEKIVAGMKVLLTRDLGYWWLSAERNAISANWKPEARLACGTVASLFGEWKRGSRGPLLVRNFASALHSPTEDVQAREVEISATMDPVVVILLNFDRFRLTAEPDLWFDRLEDVRSIWTKARKKTTRARDLSSYLTEFSKFLGEHTPIADSKFPDPSVNLRLSLLPQSPHSLTRESGILEALQAASSLSEFVALSGLSHGEARALLVETLKKCHLLLDSEPLLGSRFAHPDEIEGIGERHDPLLSKDPLPDSQP